MEGQKPLNIEVYRFALKSMRKPYGQFFNRRGQLSGKFDYPGCGVTIAIILLEI
jgi:hypothetical protein